MAGFKKIMSLAFQIGAQLDPSLNKSIEEVKKLDSAMQGFNKKAELNAALKSIPAKMKDFDKATQNMSAAWGKVANDILGPVKTIAMAGAAATTAIYGLATATAKVGDDAVKAAKKVGISTQEYSKLAYAAGLSNVSQETLSTSLRKLNLNIAGAVKGNKEAQLAFKRAGVSIYDTNGKLKSTNQILLEASDMFAKMPEGIYKADLAMALFGKSGSEMVPLMEQGSTEINRLRQEAEKLGIVFDDAEGMRATGFMDSMTTLKGAVQGMGIVIGKHLHEPLTELNKVFTEWIVANREWIGLKAAEFIQEFKNHIPEIKEFLIGAKDSVVGFAKSINEIAESMGGWKEVIGAVVHNYARFKALQIGIHLMGAATATLQFVKAFAAVAPLLASIKVGAVIGAITSLASAFMAAIPAVVAFGAALLTNPITWIVVGIGAAIAALVLLYKNWDEVTAWIEETTQEMSEFWGGVWEDIKEVVDSVATWFTETWNEVTSFFTDIWDSTTSGIMQIWDDITGYFFQKIDNIKSAFSDGFLNGVVQIFKEFNLVTLVNDMVNKVFDLDLMGIAKGWFSDGFLNGILNVIKEFNIISLMNTLINKVFGIDLLGIGKSWIKGFTDGILNGIASVAGAVKDAVGSLIPAPIKNAVGGIKNAVSGILPFAEGGIVTKPQLAVVGEAGPEAIIPLSNPNRATEIMQQVAPQLQPIQQAAPMLDSMRNVAPQIEPMQQAAATIIPQEPAQPSPIEQLSKTTNYNNSNTSNFTFSPTINLSGGGNSVDIKAAISEALSKAKSEFKSELDRWIKERDHNASRVAMA